LTPLFAFLHHLAAFTLVAALAVELVLLRGELTPTRTRQLMSVDRLYGISAGLILIIGLARVFYFEKGAQYYFHSVPFIAKLALFIVVGLLSIFPTVQFISWRADVRLGRAPVVPSDKLRRMRLIIHLQLALIAVLILCAALMARGIGYLSAS
jgi:putative membrane protein